MVAAAERGISITAVNDKIGKNPMVSAVSSQAVSNQAASTPLASSALPSDNKQPVSSATPNESQRGPATEVSWSQDALNLLRNAFNQGPDAAKQAFDAFAQAGADRMAEVQARFDAVHHQMAIKQVQHQLERLDWQDRMNEQFSAARKRMDESRTKWQNAKPVPAVQLTEAEIADVLKKAAPLGYDPSKIGGYDTYSFGIDGWQYTFKKDGTAWKHEGGIPTSEAQKQGGLIAMSDSMAYMSSKIQDTNAARASFTAQLNELTGQ